MGVSIPIAPATPEVFVERTDLAVASRVIGERDCPRCNAKVPITINDHGGSTYCPACGAEVPVGEALVITSAPAPITAPLPALERASTPPRRMRIGLVTAALIALSTIFWSVQRTTQSPRPAHEPTSNAPVPPPKPDAEITIKAIDALAKKEPPGESLALAEDWKQILTEVNVPDTDPRLARLEATIDLLRDLVVPKPAPDPPEIAQFHEQVRALTEALKALQTAKRPDAPELVAGRLAITRADGLLARHTDTLNPIAGIYRQLCTQFRDRASQIKGTKPIEALLAMNTTLRSLCLRPDDLPQQLLPMQCSWPCTTQR